MPPEYRQRIEAARPAFAARVRQETGLNINAGPFGINSRPALTLEKAAEAHGLGEAFHNQVQNAYWLEARDISNRETLEALWLAAGLPAAEFGPALDGPDHHEAVDADIALAAEYGLTGVPALVLNEQYLVVGAQPYAYLKAAVEQVAGASEGGA